MQFRSELTKCMISKNTIKFIKSLQIKKFRQENSVFVVEGAKRVCELQDTDFEIIQVYCTQKYANLFSNFNSNVEIISESEMQSISSLENNFSALALVKIKKYNTQNISSDSITLLLDGIQDPGNLGTIIRTADWFGVKTIFCSENTVDLYNPKVISATMGSFARVSVIHTDLEMLLKNHNPQNIPVYGAFLDGNPTKNFTDKNIILVMGNESNGISNELSSHINHRISIPQIGKAESLNVGIATGILLYNFTL